MKDSVARECIERLREKSNINRDSIAAIYDVLTLNKENFDRFDKTFCTYLDRQEQRYNNLLTYLGVKEVTYPTTTKLEKIGKQKELKFIKKEKTVI